MHKKFGLTIVILLLLSQIGGVFTQLASAAPTYTEKWHSFSTADGKVYNLYVISDEPLADIYRRPLLKIEDEPHILRIYAEDEEGVAVEDLSFLYELVLVAQSSARFIGDVTSSDLSHPIVSWHVSFDYRTDNEGDEYFVVVPSGTADWYRNLKLYTATDNREKRVELWKELLKSLAVQEELYGKIENAQELIEALKLLLDAFDLPDTVLSGYATKLNIPPEEAGKYFFEDADQILKDFFKRIGKKPPIELSTLTKHLEKFGTILQWIEGGTLAVEITAEAYRLMLLSSLANAAAEQRLDAIKWIIDIFSSNLVDPAILEAWDLAKAELDELSQKYKESWEECYWHVLFEDWRIIDVAFWLAEWWNALAVLPWKWSYDILRWMYDARHLVLYSSLAATLQNFLNNILEDQQIFLQGEDPLSLEECEKTLDLFQINYYLGFKFYNDYLTAIDCPLTDIRAALDPDTREALRILNSQKEEDQSNAKELSPEKYISAWNWKGWSDWTWLTQKAGLPFNFHIYVSSDSSLYKSGETVTVSVEVTNLREVATHYTLGVSFQDPYGEYEKYNPQISRIPLEVTLNPGETLTHTIHWTVPLDAPLGQYKITVNCWKNPYTEKYEDDLDVWVPIFDVYNIIMLVPTTDQPAIGGAPDNPIPVQVEIFLPVPFLPDSAFTILVGGQPATFTRAKLPILWVHELADTPMFADYIGLYGFDIDPLTQPEGFYDLEISVDYNGVQDTATEDNAIVYTAAPSSEPIDKGLAWLRTRQYGDGSWRSSVGVTALTVLAFLNAGFDETDSDVDEAIQYLISKARGDGSIYGSYPTYETSLALMALVATHNTDHQATIDAARDWLVNSQWDEGCLWGSVGKDSWYYGGFGYGWHSRPDLSNSQFALLALDAAELPKDNPLWIKAQVFLHRCQNVEFPITIIIEGSEYTVQPFNHFGGYDGGFIYYPGASLAGGQKSYGSMTGAGIWGLLLSGVAKSDQRVAEAVDWVADNYSWDTNPGIGWWRPYYYYLSMSKALTMYGQKIIDGHDWYQELYDKLESSQTNITPEQGYWSTSAEDYNPDLTTAYAILSLQTRAAAPSVRRLSYLTFVLRSNSLIRILDPNGNLVGYNYMTGMGENQIPTAIYSGPFAEPQYVAIVNPESGTYKLELVGISEGEYELAIQGNYGEEVTDTFEYVGDISPAELHGSEVTVTAVVGPVDVYTEPPEFEEIIDNTPPSIDVLTPREDPPEALMDGVTLEANVADPSGVDWVTFSIRESDGAIIDPMFESMAATDVGSDLWQLWVDTNVPELPDGHYLLLVNASDVLGNEGFKTVQFSIRNWACLELLPATESNKAGRTMPVKFSLRVFEIVDPAMPFIYNEELAIVIYEAGDPDNILQTSTYGDTARDYRIDSISELYITNFGTIRKKLTTYVVEIYRKDLLIGSFTFETVK